ncbi:MAG: alpha-L-fucosidase [Puniceicoccaceae bacterium]|nr:MAG: alpha-L-fucosidase [Puniceicoccaceae bacterium]
MSTKTRSAAPKTPRRQKPTTQGPDTSWFVQDRLGLFIHWGTYALAARHEWVKRNERMTDEAYQRYFDHFNPDLYDPREWARMAREAGMKYFVITTKHHEGFCLWDSRQTDYKATRTPYGKDLLKPMVEAFRAEGLKVGFYYSLLDWHHPDYPVDSHHPRAEDQAYRKANAGRDVRKYAAYMRAQVKELLTGFGRIDILWFDFSFPGKDGKGRADWESEKLLALVRKHQPHVLLDNRLDLPGSGNFETPEQYVPEDGVRDAEGNPVVWEGCQTFSGSWGYHRDEASWKSVPMVIEMLVNHVSRGGNLLLNVGPTGRGEFDHRAREQLRAMGEWMRLHGRSIYGCGRAPDEFPEPKNARYTWNPEARRLYVHLPSWPFKEIHLPNLMGRVAYAQLLNDASELRFRDRSVAVHANMHGRITGDEVVVELPTLKPPVAMPVIELFIRD